MSAFVSACAVAGPVGTSAHIVPAPLADGNMVALGVNATYAGVRMITSGVIKDAVLMQNVEQNFIVLMWPLKECGWATLFFDTNKMQFARSAADVTTKLDQAGLMNATTASDFVEWLKENGYKVIPTSSLPSIFAAAQQAALTKALANAPIFVFLPVNSSWTEGDVYNALMPATVQQ